MGGQNAGGIGRRKGQRTKMAAEAGCSWKKGVQRSKISRMEAGINTKCVWEREKNDKPNSVPLHDAPLLFLYQSESPWVWSLPRVFHTCTRYGLDLVDIGTTRGKKTNNIWVSHVPYAYLKLLCTNIYIYITIYHSEPLNMSFIRVCICRFRKMSSCDSQTDRKNICVRFPICNRNPHSLGNFCMNPILFNRMSASKQPTTTTTTAATTTLLISKSQMKMLAYCLYLVFFKYIHIHVFGYRYSAVPILSLLLLVFFWHA